MARQLNITLHTTAYTPETLRQMSMTEFDQLQMVADLLNGAIIT